MEYSGALLDISSPTVSAISQKVQFGFQATKFFVNLLPKFFFSCGLLKRSIMRRMYQQLIHSHTSVIK
jgi:hypothetical protein